MSQLRLSFSFLSVPRFTLGGVFAVLLLGPQFSKANVDIDCYVKNYCHDGGNSSHTDTSPAAGNEIRLNPAAVPTAKGFGVEAIFYGETEWSIVQGLGRAGAAISPSNSEETFFGPPGIENTSDYLQRHIDHEKYKSQKYNLAVAIALIDKHGSSWNQYNLNLGVMAKYNKYTNKVDPGGGLSGSWGPVLFGASYYSDQTQLDTNLDKSQWPAPVHYKVRTYNVGLYLTSVILDYSNLEMTSDDLPTSYVSVLTASLMVKHFIFTLAGRSENSQRPWYNPSTQMLETKQIKSDYFAGVQYELTKHIMVGTFYNYYLLHELSLTTTLFF